MLVSGRHHPVAQLERGESCEAREARAERLVCHVEALAQIERGESLERAQRLRPYLTRSEAAQLVSVLDILLRNTLWNEHLVNEI
jgi:hypothetical protein